MKLCEKIENINREYCNFFYYEGWADGYADMSIKHKSIISSLSKKTLYFRTSRICRCIFARI